jgi:hypothetical protein
VIESFHGYRGVLAASYELMVRAEDVPEVQRHLVAAVEEAKNALAALFAGVDPTTERERAHRVDSFYYALLSGLLTQWLIDLDQAPSGRDLAAALDELLAEHHAQ